MSMESMQPKRRESRENLEINAREATLDRIQAMSQEEFDSASKAAGLSDQERESLKRRKDTDAQLERLGREDSVNSLYMAAKYPTMNKVSNALNIRPEHHYSEVKKLNELNEGEKKFDPNDLGSLIDHDFENGLEKMKKHLA